MQSGGPKTQRGPGYLPSMSSLPQWRYWKGKNHLLSHWSLETLSEIKSINLSIMNILGVLNVPESVLSAGIGGLQNTVFSNQVLCLIEEVNKTV